MVDRARLIATVLAVLGSAFPAHADAFRDAEAAARTLTHRGYTAFAGLDRFEALRHGWSVTTFYVVWSGAPRAPHWVARRVRGGPQTPVATEWVDSRDCSAFASRLHDLEALRAPVIQIPGEQTSNVVNVMTDGVGYRLWASFGRYPGSAAAGDVEMAGNVDSPVAAWADATDQALVSCWRAAEPDA